jgi:hypothetical protein
MAMQTIKEIIPPKLILFIITVTVPHIASGPRISIALAAESGATANNQAGKGPSSCSCHTFLTLSLLNLHHSACEG